MAPVPPTVQSGFPTFAVDLSGRHLSTRAHVSAHTKEGETMWHVPHYRVSHDGHVTERGQVRGTVSKVAAGWVAIDGTGTCDQVTYGTRSSAARSLLRGCLFGIHDGPCNCR
jgi:hypothetical protein